MTLGPSACKFKCWKAQEANLNQILSCNGVWVGSVLHVFVRHAFFPSQDHDLLGECGGKSP